MSELKTLKKQAADAVREMRDWLVRDGHTPTEVEVLGRINGPGVTFFATQYKLPGSDTWLLGVAGGYIGDTLDVTGHTLTAYEPVTDTFGQDATDLIAAMDRALTAGAVADGREISDILTATLLLTGNADLDRIVQQLSARRDGTSAVHGQSRITPGPMIDKLNPIAERAYLWPDAAGQVAHHTASLRIETAGDDVAARAIDHTTLVSSLIDQQTVAIYANGTVYEPAFYQQVVTTTPAGSPPVLALVQLGLATRRGTLHGFTEGLADVGKDEFMLTGDSPEELQRTLLELASHVLVTGAVIPHNTTITLSTGTALHLTRQGYGDKAVLRGEL